jgi:hypothetical protein
MVWPVDAREGDRMAHASSTAVSAGRPLGLTWLAVSAPVAVVATLLMLISEQADDRTAGLVLFVLVAVGLALGAWILSSSHDRARAASFAASAFWLVGAVVVYPTQEFAVDALWVSGLPLLGAVLTAVVAWTTARH